ncbi:ROK family glucokinase [Alteribacillus persepolensis]|nr:ROK family glucokinase [Alteribacillus persepolensis]
MQHQYLLGIDIGGTSVKLGLFTQTGQLVNKWSIPTDKSKKGAFIVRDIAASVREQLAAEGIKQTQCIGAGVGVPGFVDIENGCVDFAVNIGWKDYPIVDILSDSLGIPTAVDNDANLAAAGEYWQGAGVGAENIVLFTLGTGVGGGVIVKGDIVHGSSGMGGEVGHVTVIPEGGAPCNCHKTGCLETVASATGIVRLAKEQAEKHKQSLLYAKKEQETLTAKAVFEAAASGDSAAESVIDESIYYLGLAAANIANVLNPEKIVIGGGVAQAGEQLLAPLRRHYRTFALENVYNDTAFTLAELGNDAGVTGAAWLAKTYAAGKK